MTRRCMWWIGRAESPWGRVPRRVGGSRSSAILVRCWVRRRSRCPSSSSMPMGCMRWRWIMRRGGCMRWWMVWPMGIRRGRGRCWRGPSIPTRRASWWRLRGCRPIRSCIRRGALVSGSGQLQPGSPSGVKAPLFDVRGFVVDRVNPSSTGGTYPLVIEASPSDPENFSAAKAPVLEQIATSAFGGHAVGDEVGQWSAVRCWRRIRTSTAAR